MNFNHHLKGKTRVQYVATVTAVSPIQVLMFLLNYLVICCGRRIRTLRPQGYEPCKLPLLYPAIYICTQREIRTPNRELRRFLLFRLSYLGNLYPGQDSNLQNLEFESSTYANSVTKANCTPKRIRTPISRSVTTSWTL